MLSIHCEPRSTPHGFRSVILLLLSAALWAMSGGSGGSAQADAAAITPLDACEFLTKADVESVYGSVVGEPNPKALGSGPFWVSMCNYDNAHTDAPMLSVGLLVKAHGDAAGPETAYDRHLTELREQLGDALDITPVTGVGARAGWSPSTSQLTVFEGPYQLILTASDRFAGDRLALAKQSANRVLARLPNP
jgi:hypothetical protein